MTITKFQVATNRANLELEITDAQSVSSLHLWINQDFKDNDLAIDLTSRLTGASTEIISITPAELSLQYFDGVYFIEAKTELETSLAITQDLTRYKECILNKILSITDCKSCLKKLPGDIVSAQTLLYSLESAIDNGYIDEVTLIISALDKYCSNKCKACGEYNNISDPNYYSLN